ncbi:cold-shock protein [Reinekea thalattae]|uniref:Cold-shock protein n=1 Tax=Reinekea thalattae TaxID=2593301 RepID=A0A5C8Z984_9GAMM|nr:cold-shock protein [Reinekea thalattae]TXR53778.1 cold-shock protein [Reinekea thalattae]
MKFKFWLVRVGICLLVALPVPFVITALLTLVTGVAELTIVELADFSFTPAKGIAFVLIVAVVALVSFLAIVISQSEVLEEDDREEGVVKWFNVSKGFGFLTREDGEDVFVHFRSIRGRGHRSLQEGQRVLFGVVESSKGLQAEDVTILRQNH